jgi:hypothetical protein
VVSGENAAFLHNAPKRWNKIMTEENQRKIKDVIKQLEEIDKDKDVKGIDGARIYEAITILEFLID